MISQPCFPDKILIVDDEANIRSFLLRHFETEGADCVASPNALDALEKMREQDFSLIISDVLMPGMSGMEFLRLAKKQNPETAFIMITGLMDINNAVDSLRLGAFDFITKPFELPAMRRAVDRALERRRLLMENRCHREELEHKIRARTFELKAALNDVEDSYKITLEALVAALDAREHETHAHSQRVREYTLTLAQNLGLKYDDLTQIGRGALLHDVGKIGVRDSILLKPGKLDEQEWIEMRRHPQIGYNILQSIEFLSPAAEIVLCHQERWDGNGYPNRLGEEDIPLGARIFAVVDALDAMTSDRPYRKALSFKTAWNEIRCCSGTQFDPRVAEAFLSFPQESWIAIHDSVNRLHLNEDCFHALCSTLNTSR
jgi:response regulator RpfG family c-di-GMP phosphodiesterase